jgi:glycosyltransferase involved in cell wall biosynthesis
VFYGTFAPLQGAVTIGEAVAACRRDAIQFTIVGRGQDHAAAKRAAGSEANVRWIDWIEAEQLPATVAEHHVCLGIFGAGAKGLRVVPHKVYEGAAAGCAIVTAGTDAQRRLLDEAAEFVPPGDSHALAETLRRLANDPDRVRALRDAAYRRASEAFHPRAIAQRLRDEVAAR